MNRQQRRAEMKQSGHGTKDTAQAVQELFAQAFHHRRSGKMEEAISCFRKAVRVAPSSPQAHNNLGTALKERGQLSEAVTCFRHALELAPDRPEAYFNLGSTLKDFGKLEEAHTLLRKAIEMAPAIPQIHNNLGTTLKELKRFDEAIICYREAIKLAPDYPAAHYNLAVALDGSGQISEAIACYKKAIELDPTLADAHNNLGLALKEQGRAIEAIACYRNALKLDPTLADAHNNLGLALKEQGRAIEATTCYRNALELKPDFTDAYNNLGIVLMTQERIDEAIACYRRAIELNPDVSNAYYNLGNALKDQGHVDDAITCYRKAIELKPDFSLAHCNLGTTRKEQGHVDGAIACYRTAIALSPDLSDAHQNLAMALLIRGDMAAGWEEYEWRWATPELSAARREFIQPRWRGEVANGQTLLIYAEQGFGDTLQFCRYVRLVASRGLRVIIEVQKPLVRLLRGLPGVDAVIGQGDPLPSFDLQIPMMSLPLVCGTTVETIPGTTPYLHADEALVAHWQRHLAAIARQGPRIGLVWAGNPRNHSRALAIIDQRRSMAPARLAPLFEVPRLHFFSLQKDGPSAPEAFPLIDVMSEMNDFADTAALIANLDLVISVDTAVAHLAAALGKPVWMLNRFDSCWRWFTDRHDSPWYPTLKLYRQPKPGEWDSVVAEIARDLAGFRENP